MSKGDIVLIRDPAHPWANSIGTLGEPLENMPGMYEVHMNGGARAGAYLSQLEKLS